MSRTACCFLALGIGVTLAAACGDDDVDFNGSGGAAGRAGAAGAAGSGGTTGDGGRGGSGGSAGQGGSSAGQGGSSAGQGGSSAGQGGSAGEAGTGGTGGSGDIPDGGPDATTPPPPDGGGVGDCPDFVAGDIVEQNGQNVIISRVVFENDGATVTFRGVGNGEFNFAPPMQLCSGPEEADCIGVEDLDDDGAVDALTVGEEETIFIPNVSNAGGELSLITNVPTIPEAFPFIYIAWGTFASIPPSEVGDAANPARSLEERALDTDPQPLWTEDDRVDVGDTPVTIDTIVATGSTASADGFEACTGD